MKLYETSYENVIRKKRGGVRGVFFVRRIYIAYRDYR